MAPGARPPFSYIAWAIVLVLLVTTACSSDAASDLAVDETIDVDQAELTAGTLRWAVQRGPAAGRLRVGTISFPPMGTPQCDGPDPACTRSQRVIASNYSLLTDLGFYWGAVEPARGAYDFSGADSVLAYARAHGMRVKGHTLVWYRNLPSDAPIGAAPSGWVDRLAPADLRTATAEHVRDIVAHYAGRVALWDVLNEALADGDGVMREGIALRPDLFAERLGPSVLDFYASVFKVAHAADPGARLIYNDYGIEVPGRKQQDLVRLVAALRRRGAVVHGVGLQMHLDSGDMPTRGQLDALMELLEAAHLDVYVTEMDVRTHEPRAGGGCPRTRSLAKQAAIYHAVVAACVAHRRCRGLSFWGDYDGDSWLRARCPADEPLLLDLRFAPKPAYRAVEAALLGR